MKIQNFKTKVNPFSGNSLVNHYFDRSGMSQLIDNKLNRLSIKSLKLTRQLKAGKCYDFDYDNQINANNKWDAKKTYKKNKGYFPGVATIGNKIVGIENRDGNANVKFKQEDTLGCRKMGVPREGMDTKIVHRTTVPPVNLKKNKDVNF